MAWLTLHFVTAYKAASIVLTGAFGVLGLLKDFKDKKGKITKWGRVSLAGILASTGFGVIAQLIETSKADQTARETAKQTLGIVKDIQRGLAPLDDPTFYVAFSLDCERREYKEFCAAINKIAPVSAVSKPEVWDLWPRVTSLLLSVALFADSKDADSFLKWERTQDLYFTVSGSMLDQTLDAVSDNGQVKIMIPNVKPDHFTSNGKLKSILDMPGVTTILIESAPRELGARKVIHLGITLKNGQSVYCDGPFTMVYRGVSPGYRCTFPQKAPS